MSSEKEISLRVRLASPALYVFLRFVLAAVFLASGVGKLISPDGLSSILGRFLALSQFQSLIVSIGVSMLELAISILLLIGISTQVVALCVLALTGLFTVGQVLIFQRSNNVDCGCFGSFLSENIGWLTIARNLTLMFGAWLLARHGNEIRNESELSDDQN